LTYIFVDDCGCTGVSCGDAKRKDSVGTRKEERTLTLRISLLLLTSLVLLTILLGVILLGVILLGVILLGVTLLGVGLLRCLARIWIAFVTRSSTALCDSNRRLEFAAWGKLLVLCFVESSPNLRFWFSLCGEE